jgi:hypothetical protein
MAVASINLELLRLMRRSPQKEVTLQGAVSGLYDAARGGDEMNTASVQPAEGATLAGGHTPRVNRLAETTRTGGSRRSQGRLYSGVYL